MKELNLNSSLNNFQKHCALFTHWNTFHYILYILAYTVTDEGDVADFVENKDERDNCKSKFVNSVSSSQIQNEYRSVLALRQIYLMKHFSQIVNGFQPSTVFEKVLL